MEGGVTVFGDRGGRCSAAASPGNFVSSTGDFVGFAWSPDGEACAVLDRTRRVTIFAREGGELTPRATTGPLEGATGVVFGEAAVGCTHSSSDDRASVPSATFLSPETGEVVGVARGEAWRTWFVDGRFAWPERWLREHGRAGERRG